MSTSVGELLDTIVDDIAMSQPGDGFSRADAAAALGHLGRALLTLRHFGISTAFGDLRERQAKALGHACRDLADTAPLAEGRAAAWAAVAADGIAASATHTNVGQRWAQACAILDVIGPLTERAAAGGIGGGSEERLAIIDRLARRLEQTAALNPASASDTGVLDSPIPTAAGLQSSGDRPSVSEAMASLAWSATRYSTQLSVAEVLAVTFAAEALCAAAAHARRHSHRPATKAPDRGQDAAAHTWASVRTALLPFNDGSRRPHREAPAIVAAARSLHQQITGRTGSSPADHEVGRAMQHLPPLAESLHRRAQSWGDSHELLAFAVDLPHREQHTASRTGGRTVAGLIRADSVDLLPVTAALHNARLLSTELAVRPQPRADEAGTRRLRTSHQAAVAHRPTAAAIDAARQAAAYEQLRAQPARGTTHRR